MNKKFFLIFIFGLFPFLLLPHFVEAACLISCTYCEGTDDCQWTNVYTYVEKIGIIGSIGDASGQTCASGWIPSAQSPDFYCSDSQGKCKNEAFPTGDNGQSCTARDGCLGLGCDYRYRSGVWDAFESQCVTCNGKKEDRILGNTTEIVAHCGNDFEGNAGDGKCESACGANEACDEVADGGNCITGKACSNGTCTGSESCNGCTCTIEGLPPETCTINGTSYSDGECNPNNKCQWCDVSASATSWSNIPSGYVCTVSGETPVSSSDYCNYNENCYDGDCSATKWWTSCDGSGSCRSASDHIDSYSETVTASNLKVLKWDCSEVSPSTGYYCDIRNVCTGGACSGDRYYRACDGGGSCRSDDTGAYHETVYANAGYSLTSGCGKNGTTLCDSTWRSSTPGDNGYGDGGDSICQGMCDSSGNCDYAVNCEVPPEFDFSISINPTSGSAVQGESTPSATVTLTLTLGDTQSVSFSASGLPSGASVSFSPTSCNPDCNSTMTITTSATTPIGTYSIDVCGTGGGKEHCTGYTLTVTEAFDFSISIAPTLSTVSQGGSASTEITVTKISGDPQTVYLGVGDSDEETGILFSEVGITFSFSPNNNCSPDPETCSRTLTISTSDSTPPATYHILISGTSGGASDSKIYTLTVIEAGEEITPPEVITESASNITQTSATLNGTLNSMGNADSCYVWFEYWLKTGDTCDPKADEAIVEPLNPVMDSVGGFSADIPGLSLDTTYCFEAYAKNGGSW